MKLLTVSALVSAALFSSFASAGPWGDVKQQTCVDLKETTYETLYLTTVQRVNDFRSTSTRSVSSTKKIDANSHGVYCTDGILEDEIHVNGAVDFDFKLKDSAGKVLASFVSWSTFNGQGASNDWDIRELNSCSVGSARGYGIKMTANGYDSCSMIKDVSDEQIVRITLTPELDSNHPDHGYPHYSAEDVTSNHSNWQKDDIAYSERTQELYQCKESGWCNQAPDSYAPGTGSDWQKAWSNYNPEAS